MSTPRPCPKCPPPAPLAKVVVDVPGAPVEIDQCARCGGTWLDWDEERALHVVRHLVPNAAGPARWQDDLKRGRCPACLGRPTLERIPVGAFGVDRCPECLGLFLDGGELGPLLTDAGYQLLVDALRAHPA